MQDRPSAEIIPFPRKEPDRLQKALVDLEKSLDEQRVAIAAWRTSLAELHEAMTGLRGSFSEYQSTLDNVAADVGQLGAESRKLEAWADGVLADHAN